MFTNAGQLTYSNMIELKKIIEDEKPLILAVSEVKRKNAKDHAIKDYEFQTIRSIKCTSKTIQAEG